MRPLEEFFPPRRDSDRQIKCDNYRIFQRAAACKSKNNYEEGAEQIPFSP